MSIVQNSQPTIRFNLAGPMGMQGVSFAPKIVTFQKDGISGTSNNDFWLAPAGTFIAQAVMFCDTVLDGTPTVTLGTDGNPNALIDTTGFDATSTNYMGTNIGSATASSTTGLYLPAADTIRLAVGGTPTQGAVSGFIVYFETANMLAQDIHFDIE